MPNENAPYVAESDTSRARAQREDATGVTRTRRHHLLALLYETGAQGAIWSELAEQTGYHHGQVSGALSKLHETNNVFQLRTTRDGCHPYVHYAYRWAYQDSEVNDEPVKTRSSRRTEALEAVAQAAHDLCYTQSINAAAKWDSLREALTKLKETEQ